MQILLSGSSGLLGSALAPRLESLGHSVVRLVRASSVVNGPQIQWSPQAGLLESEALEHIDAVIHLAGENIGGKRWSPEQKARILASRTQPTSLLARTLAALDHPPQVLICASATGFYGDRGDEILDEDSAVGTGFLPEVCQAWEEAADPARQAGIRVAHIRFGVVLSRQGGALAKMLPPFSWGVGGPMGSGRQYMGWIALEDAVGSLIHILAKDDLHGAVNAVAPEPATNAQFARALGRALHRPSFLPLPAFVARLVAGEMADALLLASTRAVPRRLFDSGFQFRHPQLDQAIDAALADHTIRL
ncbi:MAG: TIGR01777 family protein [Candidatus Latescibacteria bacterium]|nr:TIGR01777 family protein [Candidatus Latescibacterota bacterium]